MYIIPKVNPQAMASVSHRRVFDGHPDLGASVDRDTWLTPRWILAELSEFDLDPCACDLNPTWVAPRYFTSLLDGLTQPWSGRVFMNPPFSNVVPWVEKHAQHGEGISLLPASIESRVWRSEIWMKAHGILFLAGRTRFANPDGSITTGRPLRPVALVSWSKRDLDVLMASNLAGILLTQWTVR